MKSHSVKFWTVFILISEIWLSLAATAVEARWWPVQTLPKAIVRTRNPELLT